MSDEQKDQAATETAPTPETPANDTTPKPEASVSDRTYTQSELDRIIGKALETNRSKLEAQIREEAERKSLEEQKKFRELYETEKQRRTRMELQAATAKTAAELGMPALADVLDADLSNLDGRKAAGESIKSLIETEVERRVAERLRSDPPPRSGGSGNPLTADAIKGMSIEEYERARRDGRIK